MRVTTDGRRLQFLSVLLLQVLAQFRPALPDVRVVTEDARQTCERKPVKCSSHNTRQLLTGAQYTDIAIIYLTRIHCISDYGNISITMHE